MADTVDHTNEKARASAVTMQRWGALASFLLAAAFIAAPPIYLMGNLRDAYGPLSYDVADLMYGPVWAASLVTAFFALRERIGAGAPRRMSLALLAALLAAGAMLSVALIRSANRHYHLDHPELNLEHSMQVLTVWTTLVAGLSGAAWYCLGWAWILLGWAGWTSRRLPRVLSALFLFLGVLALPVYLSRDSDMGLALLGAVLSTWQGIVMLRPGPGAAQAPES